MKNLKKILIVLLIIPSIGKAQVTENVFNIQSGKAIPKANMVDPFVNEFVSPNQTLLARETVRSVDNRSVYSVSLLNYTEDILDGTPGLFREVSISHGYTQILKFANTTAWDTIPQMVNTMNMFMTIPLSPSITALLFVGHSFANEPGLLTIVVLNGTDATVVYNKHMYPIEIKNEGSRFSAYVADAFVQYASEGVMDTEELPSKYRIWTEAGMFKIQNLGKVTEDFLK